MKNTLFLVACALFPALGNCLVNADLMPGQPQQVNTSKYFYTGQLKSIVNYYGDAGGSLKAGIGYTCYMF